MIANATGDIRESTLVGLCRTLGVRQQWQDNADPCSCQRRFWRCLDRFSNEVFHRQNPACSLGQAFLNTRPLDFCLMKPVIDDDVQVLLAVGSILARIIIFPR